MTEPGGHMDEHDDIVIEDTSTALAVRQPVALSITPNVTAHELVARLDLIRESMANAMVDGVDYGRIPGTDKPTLLKPGAEKLGVLFRLDVQLVNERERDGEHLTVTSRATVYDAPTGARLGYGEGMCSTYEKKYRYRHADRACPVCNEAAIIKGKAQYGGGWVCYRRKGGCGAKFEDSDPQIVNQQVGQVENRDLADLWNTVLKMAEKRARVDAILAVTGASALFTQDVEDTQPDAPAEPDGDLPDALKPNPDAEAPAGLTLAELRTRMTDEQIGEVGKRLFPGRKLGELTSLEREQIYMSHAAGEATT